jgi:hypothetical protein
MIGAQGQRQFGRAVAGAYEFDAQAVEEGIPVREKRVEGKWWWNQ